MIVVDSLAVVAILFGEPTAAALLARLAADPDRVMSVVSYVETGTVLAGRRLLDRLRAADDLDRFLDEAGIALAAIDASQARRALRARIQHGRGWVMAAYSTLATRSPTLWPRRARHRCCTPATISARLT
jgi:uncharacterized protein with PIN domain